jgi:hypothetical protein
LYHTGFAGTIGSCKDGKGLNFDALFRVDGFEATDGNASDARDVRLRLKFTLSYYSSSHVFLPSMQGFVLLVIREHVQDLSRFYAVVFEYFVQFSAQAVGAFAPGAQRCTEYNITE